MQAGEIAERVEQMWRPMRLTGLALLGRTLLSQQFRRDCKSVRRLRLE
jgi:hypothetical protein